MPVAKKFSILEHAANVIEELLVTVEEKRGNSTNKKRSWQSAESNSQGYKTFRKVAKSTCTDTN